MCTNVAKNKSLKSLYLTTPITLNFVLREVWVWEYPSDISSVVVKTCQMPDRSDPASTVFLRLEHSSSSRIHSSHKQYLFFNAIVIECVKIIEQITHMHLVPFHQNAAQVAICPPPPVHHSLTTCGIKAS